MNNVFKDIKKMSIGDIIKLFREYKGYTQKELAEVVGVKASTISNYENNKTIPDILTLRKIVVFLKIPLKYIF